MDRMFQRHDIVQIRPFVHEGDSGALVGGRICKVVDVVGAAANAGLMLVDKDANIILVAARDVSFLRAVA